MAKAVLKTEYGLNREISADRARAAEPDPLDGIWQLLRRAADRVMRAVGLRRGGGDASPGGEPEPELSGRGQGQGQEQGRGQERRQGQGSAAEGVEQAWGPVPERQGVLLSEKTRSLHERMMRLEQWLHGLRPAQREDVEDAILKELRGRGNKKLLRALIASPDSMPVLAEAFNNATVRESERMAPSGSGDVRPPEQRRSNGEVRPEGTAEKVLSGAGDRTIAADATQFEAVRNPWARPARSRDSASPRSFQDPADNARPDVNSLEMLRERQFRERESPTPEMQHVEHYDGGAFLRGSPEGLRQTPTATPTQAEPPSPEELRSAAAQLNPLSTADFAGRPNWPVGQTPESSLLDQVDLAAGHEPVSPFPDHVDLADTREPSSPLDAIGLAVVNDPTVLRSPSPNPKNADAPSHSRSSSHVRQNGNSNGGSQARVGRR
ncbi:hypothetical protein [Streptomyces sp. NBC_00986]|uniref:hypothetical protein n=1 Tax=Streptomyces sp. NBC_00986 TaxID=2903702 RepID=UPI0038668E0F|nr:hypothetical protein OG504_19815 [Streptomyces sp. NBC_00986]